MVLVPGLILVLVPAPVSGLVLVLVLILVLALDMVSGLVLVQFPVPVLIVVPVLVELDLFCYTAGSLFLVALLHLVVKKWSLSYTCPFCAAVLFFLLLL